ncbi:hypothetical protein [Hymenobacter siberiensis]|jgi:hypothetical protein|uniref:hypothetical protein n=1 Tax=Hymenobacter siberiensis TaxID=2848396 RepID=UPI001C1E04BA|nr:hypothetical protein [Hymenobacter siberiensis]MBU6120211.1 hypothetical protein [Hymenobacter siberiensis]
MTISETPYISLTPATENHQPEQPAAHSQRCADWISYAAAMSQQVAPTTADFTESTTR